MRAEPEPHVARLDKEELAGVATLRTNPERGRYLRHLLQTKGIDPRRLYAVTYHPSRRCWHQLWKTRCGRSASTSRGCR